MQDDKNDLKAIQGWLDSISAQVRGIDKKVESLRVELQSKASEAHANIYARIESLTKEVSDVKQTLARIECELETAKKHIETDESYEDGQNRTIAGGAKWLLAATLGAFITWLVSKFGGGH